MIVKTKAQKIKSLEAQKPSLVKNINLAKLKGTSKPKSKSNITPKAYKGMKNY
jgi:hypothetical protein